MGRYMKLKVLLLSLVIGAFAHSYITAQGRGGGGRGAAATAPARNATPPTSPVSGNAATGKALYYNNGCYGCHGFNGETGRAFVGNWSSNLANEESFLRFLRARANVAPPAPS